MINPTRLRLLKQEVECMSRFGLGIVDELEASIGTPAESEGSILVQEIISIAVKISYLIWRFGRRVTDKHGQAEADYLCRMLGLSDASPLSPANMSRLTEMLSSSTEELRAAINPELMTVTVQGVMYPLRPVVTALRELHAELVEDLATPAGEDDELSADA
ncbi:MAG TPA: hypothetical protein VFQ76_10960 [Longimicrobiaceae bacterium]|nr:hypothetical protein [Longimicrobiaceae bacterium]